MNERIMPPHMFLSVLEIVGKELSAIMQAEQLGDAKRCACRASGLVSALTNVLKEERRLALRCPAYRYWTGQILTRLLGGLPPHEAAKLDLHLKACQGCCETMAELAQMVERVQELEATT